MISYDSIQTILLIIKIWFIIFFITIIIDSRIPIIGIFFGYFICLKIPSICFDFNECPNKNFTLFDNYLSNIKCLPNGIAFEGFCMIIIIFLFLSFKLFKKIKYKEDYIELNEITK